jgi:hypothetical protein
MRSISVKSRARSAASSAASLVDVRDEGDGVAPESLEPESLEPESLEPESLEPESLEPESLEPESLEPESLEPEPCEPESFEPESFDLDEPDAGGVACRVACGSETAAAIPVIARA